MAGRKGKAGKAHKARRSAAPHLLLTVASFRTWRAWAVVTSTVPGLMRSNCKRRERDLNPRYPYGYTRLPIAHLRPLGHLSWGKACLREEAIRHDSGAPCPRFRLAERGGFEPPEPEGSTVFETARFNRSRISPIKKVRLRGFEPPTFRSAI